MHETLRQIHRLFTHGTVTGLSDAALLRRFASGRDEEAFAALVSRHGPMVLGVCRGVLRDPGEAEDAFQATFLVLARRARSLWVEDSLGGWLHRVARRIAVKTNAQGLRRRGRELRGIEPDAIPAQVEVDEAFPTLHEEIDRLPEAYRRPLILCALEGLTQAQAAQVLGCGEATVRRRLAGAKERLKARLDRRGLTLPAIPGPSTVPGSWVSAASKLALADASGLAIPSTVARLAWAIAAGSLARKVAGCLAAVGLAVGLVGYAAVRSNRAPKPEVEPLRIVAEGPAPVVTPEPQTKSEGETRFQGRVFDPDGRPFVGASVFARPNRVSGISRATRSDAEGRFRLSFDAKESVTPRDLAGERVDGQVWPVDNFSIIEEWPGLIAIAPGFGVGVAALGPDQDPVIRLVADEPVEGRVLDVQGKPVAGASVRVRALMGPRQGDLTSWINAARAAADQSEFNRANYQFLALFARQPRVLSAVDPDLLPTVRTDADGRFRLVGIGRDRVAWVVIDGAGIESRLIAVATRPGLASFVVSSTVAAQRERISNPSEDLTVVGPRFDHLANRGQAVEGRVFDSKTRGPIVGATVVPDLTSFVEWSSENRFQAVTNAEGRYRVEGLPEGVEREFVVEIPGDQPYRGIGRSVAAGRGLDLPVLADFALERGIWVEGRVLDGPAGQPVRMARVDYHVFNDNPHIPRRPDRPADGQDSVETDQTGRYRVAVYPGRGLLTVFPGYGGFASGVGVDRVAGLVTDQFGRKSYPTLPQPVSPENINLVAEVNPPEGSGPVTLDLILQKGRVREGRAVGPEGVAPGDLLGSGLVSWMSGPQPVEGGRIVVKNLSPGEERRVVVRADGPKLIGLAILKADEDGPFEVKLVPWATVKGRLVDPAGKPRSKGLTVEFRDDQRLPVYVKGCLGYSNKPSDYRLDDDGRFLAEALLPGESYDVGIVEGGIMIIQSLAQGSVLKPGEAKDLGDVVVKKP